MCRGVHLVTQPFDLIFLPRTEDNAPSRVQLMYLLLLCTYLYDTIIQKPNSIYMMQPVRVDH